MNIVFVNATRGWAGIKTWMLEFGVFLAARGHGVMFVCRPGNVLAHECARAGLAVREMPFGADFSPSSVVAFSRLLRACRADVIVTNIQKDIRTAGVAAALLGIPHVNRLGLASDLRDTLTNRLLYRMLVDRVFVPSETLREQFERLSFVHGRVRAFPNAVAAAAPVERHNPAVRMAIVARLSARKQIDRVIEACACVRDLPWTLEIAGTGPEMGRLQAQVREADLADRVRFVHQDVDGFVRIDTRSFLADKDVAIQYSADEGLSWVILEYLAGGCAVIASDISGHRETMRGGVDGLLVEPDNVPALTSAMRRLITDPETRASLARAGHARVARDFSQAAVFPRVEAELLALARQGRGRRAAADAATP